MVSQLGSSSFASSKRVARIGIIHWSFAHTHTHTHTLLALSNRLLLLLLALIHILTTHTLPMVHSRVRTQPIRDSGAPKPIYFPAIPRKPVRVLCFRFGATVYSPGRRWRARSFEFNECASRTHLATFTSNPKTLDRNAFARR